MSGSLDEDEFVKLYWEVYDAESRAWSGRRRSSSAQADSDLRELFRELDRDGNGTLAIGELVRGQASLKQKVAGARVKAVRKGAHSAMDKPWMPITAAVLRTHPLGLPSWQRFANLT
eukprot:6065248-Prymnesium_polylepis.3